MRVGVVLIVLAGCGRIHFDPIGDAAGDTSVDGLPACTAATPNRLDVLLIGGAMNQVSPTLSWLGVGQGYAMAYGDNATANVITWYTRLDDTGSLVLGPVLVMSSGAGPDIVQVGNGLALTTVTATTNITLHEIALDGSALAPNTTVTTTSRASTAAAVAERGGDIGVAWLQNSGSQPAFGTYRVDGTVVVAPRPVGPTADIHVDLAATSTSWALTFHGVFGARPLSDLLLLRLGSDGAPIGMPGSVTGATASTTGTAVRGTIVSRGDRYALAWSDSRGGDNAIYYTWLAADGSVIQPPTRIAGTGATQELALGAGPRGTMLAWLEAGIMRATWIDAPDVPPIDLSSVAITTNTIGVAVGADSAVVVWSDDRGGALDLRAATLGCVE